MRGGAAAHSLFGIQSKVECMETKDLLFRAIISGLAIALFVAVHVWNVNLDAVSLGLLALAIMPWMSTLLKSAKIGGWEVEFWEVRNEQKRQRADIETLRFLIEAYVTDYELTHLRKLASGEPFTFNRSDNFRKELERLIGMGLVARREGHGVRTLFYAGDDVQKHLVITERGRAYIRQRDTAIDF
jgi:hypothetical protein